MFQTPPNGGAKRVASQQRGTPAVVRRLGEDDARRMGTSGIEASRLGEDLQPLSDAPFAAWPTRWPDHASLGPFSQTHSPVAEDDARRMGSSGIEAPPLGEQLQPLSDAALTAWLTQWPDNLDPFSQTHSPVAASGLVARSPVIARQASEAPLTPTRATVHARQDGVVTATSVLSSPPQALLRAVAPTCTAVATGGANGAVPASSAPVTPSTDRREHAHRQVVMAASAAAAVTAASATAAPQVTRSLTIAGKAVAAVPHPSEAEVATARSSVLNPYLSTAEKQAAATTVMNDQVVRYERYPTMREWSASTGAMRLSFWACIRCRIVNGVEERKCRECNDSKEQILDATAAEELAALDANTQHIAYGRGIVRLARCGAALAHLLPHCLAA